jgi:hypothetical protein
MDELPAGDGDTVDRYFMLRNPEGAERNNVAELLRGVAAEIEKLGEVFIVNISVRHDFSFGGELIPTAVVTYDPVPLAP